MTQHRLCFDSFVFTLVLQLSITKFYILFDYASGYPVFTVFLWRYFSTSSQQCQFLRIFERVLCRACNLCFFPFPSTGHYLIAYFVYGIVTTEVNSYFPCGEVFVIVFTLVGFLWVTG